MVPCTVYKQRVLRQKAATKKIFRMCFEDFLAMQVKLKLQHLSLLILLLEGISFLKKLCLINFRMVSQAIETPLMGILMALIVLNDLGSL